MPKAPAGLMEKGASRVKDALIVQDSTRAGKALAEQRGDCRNFRLVRKLKELRRGVPGGTFFQPDLRLRKF